MSEELAIFGGPKTVPDGMVKSWPPITQEDKEALLGVLESDQLHGTAAPNAAALEKEWAEYCGVKHCVVTNSGTAALHMTLFGAGVGPGDEVILPAFTYWSTAAAVLQANAIPVFVDIEPESFTMDPSLIEGAITSRTRGIMPVDTHGMPCDVDPIMRIARQRGLVVLEDACQAHGATYKGKRTGGLGVDATAFSTNRSKNLSSAEGGLFTTNDDRIHAIASRMREFREVPLPDEPGESGVFALGWGYRALEWTNAFCRSQLKRLDQNNAIRREFAEFLTQSLSEIPGVKGPATPPDRGPCYFSYVIKFCPDQVGVDAPASAFKEAMSRALNAEGVGLGQWQGIPVPSHDVFQKRVGHGKGCPWTCRWGREIEYRGEDYPRTLEFIASHSYLAGVYPPNAMALMEFYVKGFRKVLGQAKRIMERAGQGGLKIED